MYSRQDLDDYAYNEYFKFNNILKPERDEEKPVDETLKVPRFQAEGCIMDLDTAMNNIKIILDKTFGAKKVGFGKEYNYGDATVPFISYSIIKRFPNEITPRGARLFNTYKEYVEGEPTGDAFEVYRDFFDCSVEINFYANNSSEGSDMKNKFEEIMQMYRGSLKRAGLSDIQFLYEINPTHSTKFNLNPQATLVYYFQIQRITSVRASVLHNVEKEIKEALTEENPIYNDILDNLSSE